MPSKSDRHHPKFISIRLKLLVSFTILFSGVFAIAFYWFYSFSTNRAMKRVFDDMENTASGAATQIDLDSLMDFYYESAHPSDVENLAEDPHYKEQLAWFRTVHEIEPRAWPYTFVVVDALNREGADDKTLQPGEMKSGEILSLPASQRPPLADTQTVSQLPQGSTLPTVFIADLWTYYDASKAAQPFEISTASTYTLQAYRSGEPVNRPLYNDDQFGSWISTYIPLKDKSGNTLAILGVDFEADYVRQVQNAIKSRVLIVFILTYAFLFILVYFLSNIFSKPIVQLTKAAEQIGEGYYEHDLSIFNQKRLPDEISILANVFILMVSKVRQREERLKRQVAQLKIEIDESKRDKEVQQITETDFFQDLRAKALKLRQRTEFDQNNQGLDDATDDS